MMIYGCTPKSNDEYNDDFRYNTENSDDVKGYT